MSNLPDARENWGTIDDFDDVTGQGAVAIL